MTPTGPKRSWRRKREYQCHCCKAKLPYCRTCPCGFMICVECFDENKWGITNGPTWICPDCGRILRIE